MEEGSEDEGVRHSRPSLIKMNAAVKAKVEELFAADNRPQKAWSRTSMNWLEHLTADPSVLALLPCRPLAVRFNHAFAITHFR